MAQAFRLRIAFPNNQISDEPNLQDHRAPLSVGGPEMGWRTAPQDRNIDAAGDFQDWGQLETTLTPNGRAGSDDWLGCFRLQGQ